MRQRASLVRALATDPQILLMDEPFAALDAQNRLILQEELLRIWEADRKTVMFVTHGIDEGDCARRPHRRHDGGARPHQGGDPRRLCRARARRRRGAGAGDPRFAQLSLDIWRILEAEVQSCAPAGRALMRARLPERLISFASPLVLLALWQVLSYFDVIDGRFIPSPAQVFVTAFTMMRAGELWADIGMSLYRLVAGMVIGGVPGLVVGMIMGLNIYVRAALDPLMAAIYPIPKIAILPLLMLAFGLGDASKIAAVAISIFLLTALNTMAGVLAIDRAYLDVAANYKTPTAEAHDARHPAGHDAGDLLRPAAWSWRRARRPRRRRIRRLARRHRLSHLELMGNAARRPHVRRHHRRHDSRSCHQHPDEGTCRLPHALARTIAERSPRSRTINLHDALRGACKRQELVTARTSTGNLMIPLQRCRRDACSKARS